MNFGKFVRTPFLQNTTGPLLLIIAVLVMKGELASETVNYNTKHCVKSVQIRSFSGPYFPAFGLNTEQKNSVFGHFSRGDTNQT